MPDQNHRESALDLADALDRHWDALLDGATGDLELEQLDPALAAATRRIYALDTAPSPHPAFATALWEDLMHPLAPGSAHGVEAVTRGRVLWPRFGNWEPTFTPVRQLSRLAAAVMIFVLLAGSLLATLIPLRSLDTDRPLVVEPVKTPGPVVDRSQMTSLLELTISQVGGGRAWIAIERVSSAPGKTFRLSPGSAPHLTLVESGDITVSTMEGVDPIEIYGGGSQVAEQLSLGSSRALTAGDAILIPAGTAADVQNVGAETASMLQLLESPENPLPMNAALTVDSLASKLTTLTPPLSFLLHRVTLPAGGAIPGPSDPEIEEIAGAVDARHIYDIRTMRDGSIRNASAEPFDVYVLTVASSVTAEAPTDKTLVNLSLGDIPPFHSEGGIAVTNYPPGSSSRELAGRESPEVMYIAMGPMTAQVEAAPEPVRVFVSDADGVAQPVDPLVQGDEVTLQPGTTLVTPPKGIVILTNDEATSAQMIDLLWQYDSYSTERDGAQWDRGWGGKSQEITPPVSILLRQFRLVTGKELPAPASDAVSQSSEAIDPDADLKLRYSADGTVPIARDEPVDVYLLTVTNGPGKPEAPTNAETTQNQVQLEFLWQSMGGPDPLVEPYGVGVDPKGNIWVADEKDRFTIMAPDGTFRETWGTSGSGDGEFTFYSGDSGFYRGYGDVAFDADGNIYVADTGNFRVQKFAPDRSFLLSWGSEGRGDGQFITPSGIATGPDGTVYVSDEARHDVQMFSRDGQFLGVIGELGAADGQFTTPAGVAVASNGDVWVTDYSTQRIQRFTAGGEWLDVWGTFGSRDGELHNPNDVAVDGKGRVYVADVGKDQLQVFEADGRFLDQIGGYGNDPGQFNDALGIALGPDGTVYVSDRHGIQAFRLKP